MEIDTKGIELGDKVRDTITGLEGKVAGVHQYLTGCARISIQPPAADGKVPDTYGADVINVELIERAVPAKPVDRSVGGPRNDPHRRI